MKDFICIVILYNIIISVFVSTKLQFNYDDYCQGCIKKVYPSVSTIYLISQRFEGNLSLSGTFLL